MYNDQCTSLTDPLNVLVGYCFKLRCIIFVGEFECVFSVDHKQNQNCIVVKAYTVIVMTIAYLGKPVKHYLQSQYPLFRALTISATQPCTAVRGVHW